MNGGWGGSPLEWGNVLIGRMGRKRGLPSAKEVAGRVFRGAQDMDGETEVFNMADGVSQQMEVMSKDRGLQQSEGA